MIYHLCFEHLSPRSESGSHTHCVICEESNIFFKDVESLAFSVSFLLQ